MVPDRARSCPECGADEQTGWSDSAQAQRLGLPDDKFDYDEFAKEEFSSEQKLRPRGIGWMWWLVALAVLAAFAYTLLR
jgi:hypothetical protein